MACTHPSSSSRSGVTALKDFLFFFFFFFFGFIHTPHSSLRTKLDLLTHLLTLFTITFIVCVSIFVRQHSLASSFAVWSKPIARLITFPGRFSTRNALERPWAQDPFGTCGCRRISGINLQSAFNTSRKLIPDSNATLHGDRPSFQKSCFYLVLKDYRKINSYRY